MGITVLTEKLAMSRVDNPSLKLRERLSKQDLLIVDDIGLRKLSQDMAVDLHEMLEDRQDKSTLFTK
jgi:DNA replication protein DnaC